MLIQWSSSMTCFIMGVLIWSKSTATCWRRWNLSALTQQKQHQAAPSSTSGSLQVTWLDTRIWRHSFREILLFSEGGFGVCVCVCWVPTRVWLHWELWITVFFFWLMLLHSLRWCNVNMYNINSEVLACGDVVMCDSNNNPFQWDLLQKHTLTDNRRFYPTAEVTSNWQSVQLAYMSSPSPQGCVCNWIQPYYSSCDLSPDAGQGFPFKFPPEEVLILGKHFNASICQKLIVLGFYRLLFLL